MSKCSCGTSSPNVYVFDLNSVTSLATTAAAAATASGPPPVTHLLTVDGRALVASGTQHGQRGCFHFKIFNSLDAALCWNFIKFQITPQVDVEIDFKATVAGLQV